MLNVPDHIKNRNANNGQSGVAGAFGAGLGESIPRISLKGNRFRRVAGGNEVLVEANYIDLIILGAGAQGVGRLYYDVPYDPDAEDAATPACYSEDGEAPSDASPRKQATACQGCPKNDKGSAADGSSRACGFAKYIAVSIPGDPTEEIYALKCGGQTIFAPATEGYYNMRSYAAMLAENGVEPQQVRTRIAFNPNSSTPQIMFAPGEFLNEAELAATEAFIGANTKKLTDRTRIFSGDNDMAAGPAVENKAADKPAAIGGPAPDAPADPAPADPAPADPAPAPADPAPAPAPAPASAAPAAPADPAPAPAPAPADATPAAPADPASAPASTVTDTGGDLAALQAQLAAMSKPAG
jgi:hypothetical protein